MSVIRVCCCNTLTLIHYCVYGSQDIMKTLWPDFSVQCTDVLQVSFAWQLCVADTHYVLVKCTHFIVWISDGHRGYSLRPISLCSALLWYAFSCETRLCHRKLCKSSSAYWAFSALLYYFDTLCKTIFAVYHNVFYLWWWHFCSVYGFLFWTRKCLVIKSIQYTVLGQYSTVSTKVSQVFFCYNFNNRKQISIKFGN